MPPGVFRLLLAFVVVIHHSFPLRLGAWAVGMFFVLSGFWISRMWRRKYSLEDAPYRTFVISRWWRLAPLYLAVQLLAAGLVVSGFPVGNPRALTDWHWWVTQPLVAGSTQFDRLLPPSWSLDVEMQFYLVAPFMLVALSRMNRTASVVLISVLAAWGLAQLHWGATLDTPRFDLFAWLFVAGAACEQFEWRPSRLASSVSAGVLMAVIGAAIAFPETRNLVWMRGSDMTVVVRGSEIFFLITTVVALPLALGSVYRNSSAWDRWLGDLSYPLYLFHWIPRDWYYANVDWSRPAWQNAILLLTNVAIALVGAMMMLHLLDRPAQRWRAQWLARRSTRSTKLRPRRDTT